MNVYLIRHAHAGDRGSGPRDIDRPLSEQGHRRALELAEMLSGEAITRILSSPATRCTQTVEPLAQALGLPVEEHHDLWEGSRSHDVAALLAAHRDGDLVACSHGDVIPEVIEQLAAAGVAVHGRGCEKGSLWLLERDGDGWMAARYISRKATALTS